jgi:murein DD-endopeptidase MepM/ murein hydrolase activator NlpD
VKKYLEKRINTISVKVKISLWATLKKNKLNTELIPRLEEVFNRKVNFSKLMPNDSLVIKFEEYYDAGESVRVGSIIAVKLVYSDSTVAAFQYSHCGTEGYFDENGNNLHTTFLPSPIKNARITSGYSVSRMHPITKKSRRHPAIDFAAPPGTPVLSVGDGAIFDSDYSESAGNYIKIRHSSNYTSQYLHLSRFADGMNVGMNVRKGDVIGFVGDTGFTTGPHLDFRFTKDGKLVDYLKIDLPDGQPVDIACLDKFGNYVHQINFYLEENS